MENKIFCTLTYAPQNTPNSTEAAKSELTKFIQRLRYYAKKHRYAPLRYKCVSKVVDDEWFNPRVHHHVAINFSSSEIITKIWGNGLTHIQPITDEQFQGILRRRQNER